MARHQEVAQLQGTTLGNENVYTHSQNDLEIKNPPYFQVPLRPLKFSRNGEEDKVPLNK